MARPTSTLRLRDIDPSAVAAEITECVTAHVARLASAIDAQLVPARPGDTTTLGYSTQLLAGYAQRGLDATDWPDHSCAIDAIQSVCEALYSQAGDPGTFGVGDLTTDVDATDAIGVVLLAAHARWHISQRQRVPVRELAALASVDPDHVRLLGRQGEIEVEDGEVRAAEARRWLSGRGIAGL